MPKTALFLLTKKRILKNISPAILIWLLINYLLFFFEPSPGDGHIPHLDKIVHFCLFSSFSFAVYYGMYRTWLLQVSSKLIILSFLCILIYAGSTELIQHNFVLGRTGDWYDFFADILGTIAGLITLQRVKSFI